MAHIIVTDMKDFHHSPLLSIDKFFGKAHVLFGKEVLFRDDYWSRNVHIKITDRCNANCGFCIEKSSHIKEDKLNLLHNLGQLLSEMDAQGILSTVSITGGEPTMCDHLQDVLNMLSAYKPFVTMNTNGRTVKRMLNPPDWINISKHDIDDSSVMGIDNLTLSDLYRIKLLNRSKLRLQAVLLDSHMDTPAKIVSYMEKYSSIADDFSFRELIKTGHDYHGELLHNFRKWLLKNAKFTEQVIQDYYVYETWDFNGKMITTSFSDMGTLAEGELIEDRRIFREVIVHPDGLISGDWGRSTKILIQ